MPQIETDVLSRNEEEGPRFVQFRITYGYDMTGFRLEYHDAETNDPWQKLEDRGALSTLQREADKFIGYEIRMNDWHWVGYTVGVAGGMTAEDYDALYNYLDEHGLLRKPGQYKSPYLWDTIREARDVISALAQKHQSRWLVRRVREPMTFW